MSTTETKLAQNRVFAKNLGWKPSDLGATDFNTLLVTLIATQQQIVGINVDGVCGPHTYTALLVANQVDLRHRMQQATGDARLELAGQIAMIEIKLAWLSEIIDLPAPTSADYARCQTFIDDCIRTPEGINWTWEPPYTGGFEWCGTAAAKGWGAAGLLLALRQKFFASTYRLDRWARYQPIDNTAPNKKPATGPYRMILELDERSTSANLVMPDGTRPRAGDIVTMGPTKETVSTGLHIETIEYVDLARSVVGTIGGNATGLDPNGTRVHGVARAERLIGSGGKPTANYILRRVIRPAPADLAP